MFLFEVLLSTYQTTLCHNVLQYETSLPLESPTIYQLLDRGFSLLSHQVWKLLSHMLGNPITAVVFRTAIRETHCFILYLFFGRCARIY